MKFCKLQLCKQNPIQSNLRRYDLIFFSWRLRYCTAVAFYPTAMTLYAFGVCINPSLNQRALSLRSVCSPRFRNNSFRRHQLTITRFTSRASASHASPPPADPRPPVNASDFGPRYAQSRNLKRPRPIDAAKLSVKPGVEGGRGVVAEKFVAPGEVAACVPEEATLSVCFADALTDSANDDCPFPPGEWVSHAYWRVADWDSKLVCLLLYHRGQGASSPWAHYIATLPSPDELWTAADIDSRAAIDLQYTPMIDAVEVYRFRLAAELDRLYAALPPHLRDDVTPFDFAWAMKIVHSRAFSIPPGGFAASTTRMGLRGAMQRGRIPRGAEWPRKFAMVPFLDMMNHGSGDGLATFKYDEDKQVFQLIAGDKGFNASSQVLVSYGDLTNDDLMLLYGFVQAGNPSDVFELEDITGWTVDHPVNQDWNLFQRKLQLLEDVGLTYEGRKFLVSRSSVDEHLIAALRVLHASAEDFYELATTEDGKRLREPSAKWYSPVSLENELSVWNTVERHCDRILAEFPTSLDEDEELIIMLAASSKESDVSVSAPLLFRVEKKRILRDVVQMAAMKQLCIATQASAENERTLLRQVIDLMPPPPETWKHNEP